MHLFLYEDQIDTLILKRIFAFAARTNGDPHITTLDGYSYTFNGVGEFFYVKTMDETFQSHIRFEQFQKENGKLMHRLS